MIRFLVKHVTHYKYSARVTRCYNLANVIPRDTARQHCVKNRISLSPLAATTHKRTDYFGNRTFHFEIQKPHNELIITAESEVEITVKDQALNLDLGISYHEALETLGKANTQDTIEAREFLLNSPMIECSEALADYARPSFARDRSLKSCVSELTTRIFNEFDYDPQFSTIATPLTEVLKHKKGVCQDFAHLQVGCLRSMGIPAKYVSGWFEFDPTNDVLADSDGQHIVTAFGRDYYDVTPVKGVIFGGGESPVLSVSVDVSRVAAT